MGREEFGLSRMMAALPGGYQGLLRKGLLYLECPTTGPAIAWTRWDSGDQLFRLCVRSDIACTAPLDTLQVMMRHEVAHVMMGHFLHVCHDRCDQLASEAEVNGFFREEELCAVEDAIPHGEGETPQVLRPEIVVAMAGLLKGTPPKYPLVHSRLHKVVEKLRELLQDWCGGVQVGGEEGLDAEVGALQIALDRGARAEIEKQGGPHWGSESAGANLAITQAYQPSWAVKVGEWLKQWAEREFVMASSMTKPRMDWLRHHRVYLPGPSYELKPKRPTVVVVVDTSGSMSGELRYLMPAVQYLVQNHVKVRLIQGDTRVLSDVELRRGSDFPPIKGGGGTDIRPLHKAAEEYKPKALVSYTDGYIPEWPKDLGVPTLWVVPKGTEPPYGEVVRWEES